MPRIPPSLFRKARKQISPFAPLLLPVCRTLDSTANELRWIKQHVNSTESLVPRRLRVWQACLKRGERGMPLQYILGTQPFGPLEILCRPGVLIPRPETESLIYHLHSLLPRPSTNPSALKVLDLCTGTGCIPLLLSSLLPSSTQITGVDISPQAKSLSRENLTHNIALGHLPASASKSINFIQADIFNPSFIPSLGYKPGELDVLVSNPPYISSHGFNTVTERSVRLFEPKLALVPQVPSEQYDCEPEDVFYARLLEIVSVLKPKRVFFEVGDLDQAARVAAMVARGKGVLKAYAKTVGVWRDEPGVDSHEEGVTEKMWVDEKTEVEIKGQGNGRGVYFWRGDGEGSG